MAVFIIRMRYGTAATPYYPSTPYFTDVPANAFGFPSIQRMKYDGITSGCTATTYCPDNDVLRQDMAVFIIRAAYNQFLPAGQPYIAMVTPSTIPSGATTQVTVTGVNTNWTQQATRFNNTPYVTATNFTVTSPTSFTVDLTATAPNPAEPQPIWVSTGGAPNQVDAVLPNGLTIQ
jgi:hypothetical protein